MCAILEEDTVPHSEIEEKKIPPKGIGALRLALKGNQVKRADNGTIVTYKDGKDYLVSPGYTAVSVSAFKSFCKNSGFGEIIK